MATSTIKKMGGIVRETFTQSLRTSTFYGTATFNNIAKDGYTPISATANCSQRRYHTQIAEFTDTTISVWVADYSTSGMDLTVTLSVVYLRNDLA